MCWMLSFSACLFQIVLGPLMEKHMFLCTFTQSNATLGQICVWIVDNLKQTDLQSVAFTVDCNRGFQTRTYNDNN